MSEEILHHVEKEETNEQACNTTGTDNQDHSVEESNHKVTASEEDLNNAREQLLREREEALLKREQEFEMRMMEIYAKEELSKVRIPENLSKFIVGDTKERTLNNIADLKLEFDAAFQEAVEKRLTGRTPKYSAGFGRTETNINEQVQKIVNGGRFE